MMYSYGKADVIGISRKAFWAQGPYIRLDKIRENLKLRTSAIVFSITSLYQSAE